MTDLDTRCLEAFPEWIRSLSDDAVELGKLLDGSLTEPARRRVAGALNYLFKSLDLIQDGIEDLGFVDDAFVLRVTAALVLAETAAEGPGEVLPRLAGDAALLHEFLGADYARLEAYVQGLTGATARGRSVDDVVGDAEVRAGLLSDLKSWADSYQAPNFSRDAKTLVKLRSFLTTKLPS